MYHYAQKVFDIQLGQTDEAFKDLDNLTCWISWSVYIITWVKPFNMLKIALAYIQAFFLQNIGSRLGQVLIAASAMIGVSKTAAYFYKVIITYVNIMFFSY